MFSLLEVVHALVQIVEPELLMSYRVLVKRGTKEYTLI